MTRNFAARVVDNTHFYFTYSVTGTTSGGTYIVSGDTLIVSMED